MLCPTSVLPSCFHRLGACNAPLQLQRCDTPTTKLAASVGAHCMRPREHWERQLQTRSRAQLHYKNHRTVITLPRAPLNTQLALSQRSSYFHRSGACHAPLQRQRCDTPTTKLAASVGAHCMRPREHWERQLQTRIHAGAQRCNENHCTITTKIKSIK